MASTTHIPAHDPRRLLVTRAEAAARLGISMDSFERHVQPYIETIRHFRNVLVPVAELERWVKEHRRG